MSTTGNSATLRSKLEIGDDSVFTVRRAPQGFAALLGDIGSAVWQHSLLAPLDLIVSFQTLRSVLQSEWPTLTEAAQPSGSIWVAWPREGGGTPTDLDEALVRKLATRNRWVVTKACSIDGTWDALRFTQEPERLRPKDQAKRRR